MELLQHLAVAHARGKLPALPCVLTRWLNELGNGLVGRMEDPAEDVFVSRVSDSHRDYLIFEGLYESSAFYLQRFVNVLDDMPRAKPFANLKHATHALLALSDETVRRSGLKAFTVGNVEPLATVTKDLVRRGRNASSRVVFGDNDLVCLDVSRDDIKDFIFDKQASYHA